MQAAINTIKNLKEEGHVFRAKAEMGVERIKAIVESHKHPLERRVEESLAKGWREWLTQVVELQTFRADQVNQLKVGKGFFKMDKSNKNEILGRS